MSLGENWANNHILSIDKALKAGVPKLKCFVYKISVGGKEYVGFTSQNPKTRMKQHLESAQNDSMQKLHQELRRFGFIYNFDVISEHENEVLGLVAEISNIEKYKPELNVSMGGEGNNYKVEEGKNHLGENILLVIDKIKKEELLSIEKKEEIKKLDDYESYIKKFEEWHELKRNNVKNLTKDFFLYLEDKFVRRKNQAIVNQNKYSPENHKEIMYSFNKLFTYVHNTKKQELVFKDINNLNVEIEKIVLQLNLERKKWEKNNPPSFFQSVVAFDNKWMNPFPRQTTYEKKKLLPWKNYSMRRKMKLMSLDKKNP